MVNSKTITNSNTPSKSQKREHSIFSTDRLDWLTIEIAKVIIKDVSNPIIYLNNNLHLKYLNFPSENLINKKSKTEVPPQLEKLFPELITDDFIQAIEKLKESDQKIEVEYFNENQNKLYKVKIRKTKDGVVLIFNDLSGNKNILKELIEHEKELNNFNKEISDVFWKYYPDSGITSFELKENSGLGYKLKEIKAFKDWWEINIHPSDVEKIRNQFYKSIKNKECNFNSFHYRFKKKDGFFAYILDQYLIIRNKKGKAIKLIGAMRDITERIVAMEVLNRSEEQYRNLFENHPQSMYIFDKDSLKIIAVNSAALKHYGYSRKEFLELTLQDIRPSEDREQLSEYLKSMSGGINYPTVWRKSRRLTRYWRHVKKDGTIFFADVVHHSIVFNNKPTELAIVNDVTEKKLAEDKLIESEENLRREKNILASILESMSDGVVVADLEGKFLMFNNASEKFGGKRSYKMTESEWIKKYGFFYPDSEKKLSIYETPLVRSINGEVLDNIDLMAKSVKGKGNIYILASSRPLKDNENKIIGALAVYHDITERVRNEEKIRDTTYLLREFANSLQNAREDERAHISKEIHDEIGQSLTGIKLDISWLQKRLQSGDSVINQKLIQISDMIDETVNKIRKISTDLRPGILDELGIIPAIQWLVQEFNEHTGIKAIFNCNISDLNISKDKSTTLFRIAQESLTNIARHSGAKKVKVTLNVDERSIFLTVSDNGKGIKKDKISNLSSIGILGMRERVIKLNGSFSISQVNKSGGTEVKVVLPHKVN